MYFVSLTCGAVGRGTVLSNFFPRIVFFTCNSVEAEHH